MSCGRSGRSAPPLLEVLVDYLDGDQDGHTWAASQLVSDPGYVLGHALRESHSKVFAAYLHQLPSHAVEELRLGKKAAEQLAEAEKLHKQVNQHAFGPPPVRFIEQDVDEARAAGVLIELERSMPIIVDRPLYRELAKRAITRTVEQLQADAERAKAERTQTGKQRTTQPADPVEEAQREHGRRLRELSEQAHGANLDLGAALMNGLAVVDPAQDMRVARFYVYALLGSDYDGSPYTQSGDLVAELAVRGIRLVIDEFHADVTRTRKDGSRGKLRIDYGDPKQPEKPIAWLWRFLDGARTPAELYGRGLVVVAAEQYACRLVVPSSQRFGPKRWPSHNDHAAKALAKLAGPHLPTTLKQLEKAIATAHAELRDAQQKAYARKRRRSSASRRTSGDATDGEADGDQPVSDSDELGDAESPDDAVEDEDLDDAGEDIDDAGGAIGPNGQV
jgi:hypothetical protein